MEAIPVDIDLEDRFCYQKTQVWAMEKPRSEILWEGRCCWKTTVETWVKVGERSLDFSQKNCQQEFTSRDMAEYLTDFNLEQLTLQDFRARLEFAVTKSLIL